MPELYIAPQKLMISQQNPFSSAANLYNALPVSLRLEPRYDKFVSALKEFLYLKKFYDSGEFLAFVKNLKFLCVICLCIAIGGHIFRIVTKSDV